MSALIYALDNIARLSGRLVSWLMLAMTAVCCAIVLLRYGFNAGSTALQEILLYCHGTAFMLGAAYTLQQDEHVRVDIFYQRFNRRQKAWVDAIGTLVFLLPFSLFLCASGAVFFRSAWLIREGSSEPGGLAFVYLFKGLIPLAMLLLTVQALSLLLRNANILVRREH